MQHSDVSVSKILQTIIGINTSNFCLIPKAIFSTEKISSYLDFIGIDHSGSIIKYDWLTDLDIYLIYTISKSDQDQLNYFFPNNKTFHACSGLIEAQSLHSIRKEVTSCYLHVNDKNFSITITNGRKLQFFNIFDFKTEEDITYYTLFSIEQSGLLPHKVKLYVSGSIDQYDTTWKSLFNYIKTVETIEPSSFFAYSDEIKQNKPHKFYNLFSQFLCA